MSLPDLLQVKIGSQGKVHVSSRSRINTVVDTFSENKYQDNRKHELKNQFYDYLPDKEKINGNGT